MVNGSSDYRAAQIDIVATHNDWALAHAKAAGMDIIPSS